MRCVSKRAKQAYRLIVLILLPLQIFVFVPAFGKKVWAAGPDKQAIVNEQIKKARTDLERLKRETEGKRKKNSESKKKEESILSLLESMDHRLKALRQEADAMDLRVKKEEDEISELTGVIKGLRGSIQGKKEIISVRVRALYREKKNGGVGVLLASRDYPDFLRRFYYLNVVAKKESALLALFRGQHRQLEEKGQRLLTTKRQLEHEQESLAQKLAEIRSEKKGKDLLLARVRNEQVYHEKALAELDESGLHLQAMLKRLEGEKARTKRPATERFFLEKGRLIWPNEGEVVALFGRQKHPKFDTYVYRRGIEIAPSKGDQVRAIYDGGVIYADWFKGYGMVVIVDHGENYYSMYAHLAKLFVTVGDRAFKNKTVGLVGETGLSKGNHLYFEIRYQGEPLDPLAWLQKKR